MIRPLRRLHRRIWPLLALVAGGLYLAALAARPEHPRMESLPPALGAVSTGESG